MLTFYAFTLIINLQYQLIKLHIIEHLVIDQLLSIGEANYIVDGCFILSAELLDSLFVLGFVCWELELRKSIFNSFLAP